MLSQSERTRYKRQILLQDWGIRTQERLKNATVFVAGCGGSGSPILTQLALLGVGHIKLCDYDTVELSNLNRQFLHSFGDTRIGHAKAESAKKTILSINPEIKVTAINQKIVDDNVDELVGDAEIIMDSVDQISSKFVLSQCAVRKNIPHLFYGMMDINAFACIFDAPKTPCFHCLFDQKKNERFIKSSALMNKTEKIITPVACPPLFLSSGYIVNEMVKILTGIGQPALNEYTLFLQKSSEVVGSATGFNGMRFWMTDHFLNTSKNQGFDWVKGWNGNVFEQLKIEPKKDCPNCSNMQERKEDNLTTINLNLGEQKEKDTIVSLFQNQVIKNSDNIAIKASNCEMTYNELDKKSDSVAKYLLDNNVPSGSIVPIYFDRTTEMFVAMVGVLKAGCSFLPLGIDFPISRIKRILSDCKSNLILTTKEVTCPEIENVKNLFIENSLTSVKSEKINIDPNELAYVLYTSGSTGTPNGIMIEHKNVVNLVKGLEDAVYKKYSGTLNVAMISPYYFDGSMKQIFGALLQGNTLVISDENERFDGNKLIDFYNNNKIDISDGTPTHLKILCHSINKTAKEINVKHFLIGGENLSRNIVSEFANAIKEKKNTVITNVYGVTECCVDSSYKNIELDKFDGQTAITIGTAMQNQEILILDEDGNEQKAGVVGEICIAGANVGRGYINNPESLSHKFIEPKHSNGVKIFRTGDSGIKLPNGEIDFVGRLDKQVQLRGFRIELGEIEGVIEELEEIKKAIVLSIIDDNSEIKLYAFVETNNYLDNNIVSIINNHIKESLPSYMLPSAVYTYKKLPVTQNGKVDSTILRDDVIKYSKEEKREVIQPTSPVETEVLKVWVKILKSEQISTTDDFFDIGGNSLLAIQVELEILKLGYCIDELSLYESRTIKDISELLMSGNKQAV